MVGQFGCSKADEGDLGVVCRRGCYRKRLGSTSTVAVSHPVQLSLDSTRAGTGLGITRLRTTCGVVSEDRRAKGDYVCEMKILHGHVGALGSGERADGSERKHGRGILSQGRRSESQPTPESAYVHRARDDRVGRMPSRACSNQESQGMKRRSNVHVAVTVGKPERSVAIEVRRLEVNE